ncbi:hypothetical protein BDR22DRAFT_892327 [Usnea florida]
MGKTKPDTKAHATKAVATNAIFKKAGKQALGHETTRHTKDAIEKPTKAFKSNKSKHTPKNIPEQPFASDFIATVEQSRKTIEEKAISALDAVYHTLSEHLVESYDFFTQREQDLVNVHDTLVRSLVDQELEWKSTDGKQSGKTMLGVRMKKFQKTIDEEEKEFKHQYDEWTRVQDDFRQIASYIVGPDGLDNLLAGKFDPDCFVDAERAQMMEEIEAEKRSFMEQIEMAGREAIEAMTESEKKLELKQKKNTECFLAILRDEE